VIAACNDDQDAYSILSLDPALYDRFLVIKFRPTADEWMAHAASIKVHDCITKYIKKHSKDLDPPDKLESGKKYSSRRSWVALSDVIKYMQGIGDDPLKDLDYLTLLAIGYVGSTIALNFVTFIKKDYKVFAPEDILSNFRKFKEDFEHMEATDYAYYNNELVDYIKGMKTKLSKSQCENLFDYVKTIPKEIQAGFWTSFLDSAKEKATAWFQSDPSISDVLRTCYKKK